MSEELGRSISVGEDLRIFTLFALLNAAGYDDENSPAGMHPVRVRVRTALASELPSQLRADLVRFYRSHPRSTPFDYAVVAMATNGPPDFVTTPEWTDEISKDPRFGSLSDLQGLLREFYAGAHIPVLYEQVRPAYLNYIRVYDSAVRRDTTAVLEYLRVRKGARLRGRAGEHNGASVIPNLLESYEKAFSFVLNGRFISVEGPQHSIGYNPHEFVHSVTNELSYDPEYARVEAQSDTLVRTARARLGDLPATRSGASFFDECLVRAIALRYQRNGNTRHDQDLDRAVLSEWRGGWILERFFYDELARFEERHVTLRAWYAHTLRALNVSGELERWRSANAVSSA